MRFIAGLAVALLPLAVVQADSPDKEDWRPVRIGSGVSYEYVFHPTEKTHRESLFRWENNGWTEMDLSAIGR